MKTTTNNQLSTQKCKFISLPRTRTSLGQWPEMTLLVLLKLKLLGRSVKWKQWQQHTKHQQESEPKPKQRWWPQQHFSSFGVKNQEPQGIGAMKKRGQSIQPANLTGAALENCSAPLHTKLTRMLRNGNAQKTTDSGATADGTGVTFNYANKRNQLFNNSFK